MATCNLGCVTAGPKTTQLNVRTISTQEHRDFVAAQSSVSFLQTPAWAQVKAEWRAESLGWFEGETLRGAALVLYRQLPRIRKSAY